MNISQWNEGEMQGYDYIGLYYFSSSPLSNLNRVIKSIHGSKRIPQKEISLDFVSIRIRYIEQSLVLHLFLLNVPA